ncbi:MAG: site-specific integrase [Nitrospinaceae bacterium]|nr:site-specific integrase [Nitrospinaceae bacterium]
MKGLIRGQGRVFKRNKKYWIAFYVRGEEHRESAGYKEADAKKLLRIRLEENHSGKFIGAKKEKITVNDLLDSLIIHLENMGAKSVNTLVSHLKPIREMFGCDRAVDLNGQRIEKYIQDRKSGRSEAANATINRGLGGLKQAFNLARKQGCLNHELYIPKLKEDNARQGFFEKKEFDGIVAELPDYLKDFVRFAYQTGWRKGEMVSLTWGLVDRSAKEIRLQTSKNGTGRCLPLEGELWNLIERRWSARKVESKNGEVSISHLVFHREGVAIGDFRKAWKTACNKAGYPGKLFHDFRRTAARNMTRAGVTETVAMSITGHKTASMFQRYNITSSDDKRQALIATQEHVNSLSSE